MEALAISSVSSHIKASGTLTFWFIRNFDNSAHL